jgi:ATP-dependent DNA helicase RecQ
MKKKGKKMLFSIGYQNIKSTDELYQILKGHGMTHILDVRSRPYSRKKAFNRNRLKEIKGIKYMWIGDRLGGFSEIDEKSIQDLAVMQRGIVGCLMCLEADPDQCHRKNEIAERLKKYGVNVTHIK